MKIKNVKIQNFRSYYGYNEFNFDKDLVYITGENNSGKSTLFQALDVLINGTSKQFLHEENKNKQASSEQEMYISLTFSGDDIEQIIQTFANEKKKDVFCSYIYEENGEKSFQIRRSDKVTKWQDSTGKFKDIDEGCLSIYNKKEERFENPSGIEPPLKSLFRFIKIDANTSAEDNVNFKNNGTIGELIGEIANDFSDCEEYKKLEEAHEKAFTKLKEKISPNINEQLTNILSQQYQPNTNAEIEFFLPTIDKLLSNARLLVDDGDGVETEYQQKGHGLQRSIALALIQLRAEFYNDSSKEVRRPVFYFIDEPEAFLHPRGQHNLRNALEKLSMKDVGQIFICTHSIYMLDQYNKNKQNLIVLEKVIEQEKNTKIEDKSNYFIQLYGNPTPSEISYFAFNLPTHEFHNELYNYIQVEYSKKHSIKDVDNILVNGGIKQELLVDSGYEDNQGNQHNYRTLPTKIRNIYHHGSPDELSEISESELQLSIQCLCDYITKMRNKEKKASS